jgi:short-subunit dehydrogenase
VQALKRFSNNFQTIMQGKVAIITGSSAGIGKALAIALGERGAGIVLNGRNEQKLESTRGALAEQGLRVVAVPGDVSNYEDCRRLVRRAVDHFGKIDILINNAGLAMEGEVEHLHPDTLKKIVEVNFLGAAYITQLAIPHIRATQGNILFISSLAGIHGLPGFSAYSASKMALSALAESLKIELNGTGVHVGVAYVGFTENDPNKTIYRADGQLETLPRRQNVKVTPVEKVARRLIRKLERRRHKSIFSSLGKILFFTKRLSPALVERILTNSYRRKTR